MIPTRHTSPWLEALNLGQPALDTDLEFDVAIIGAGIMGLIAAHRLAK